jgi:hypothetical protein
MDKIIDIFINKFVNNFIIFARRAIRLLMKEARSPTENKMR